MARLLGKAQDFLTKKMHGKEIPTLKKSFYETADKDMEGNDVLMSSFKDSVLCAVNVASK